MITDTGIKSQGNICFKKYMMYFNLQDFRLLDAFKLAGSKAYGEMYNT